jgi:hypothetical protein
VGGARAPQWFWQDKSWMNPGRALLGCGVWGVVYVCASVWELMSEFTSCTDVATCCDSESFSFLFKVTSDCTRGVDVITFGTNKHNAYEKSTRV